MYPTLSWYITSWAPFQDCVSQPQVMTCRLYMWRIINVLQGSTCIHFHGKLCSLQNIHGAFLCDLVLTFKIFPSREGLLIYRTISQCKHRKSSRRKEALVSENESVRSQIPSYISQVTRMVPSVGKCTWLYNQELKEIIEGRKSKRKNSQWA